MQLQKKITLPIKKEMAEINEAPVDLFIKVINYCFIIVKC